jgi:chromosome segregation ATPase
MIFLIGKIFVYLFLAGAVGGAAGWLFRNLQAQRTEESAQRAATDAKSKVPQLESLLRGRDEQIAKFKDMLAEHKSELGARDQDIRALEEQLRDQQRAASRLAERAQARMQAGEETFEDGADYELASEDRSATDNMLVELSGEIARLKSELERAQADPSASADESVLEAEVEALRIQLATAERDLQTATADLEAEQLRVSELESERELQNRSLQVLHQQLELERTRRVASG